MHPEGDNLEGHSKMVAVASQKKEASAETESFDSLLIDGTYPEL